MKEDLGFEKAMERIEKTNDGWRVNCAEPGCNRSVVVNVSDIGDALVSFMNAKWLATDLGWLCPYHFRELQADIQPNPDYDPKLKTAMEEIKTILRQNNLGAHISLVSQTHSEYYFHLPIWAAISWQDNVVMRAKCRRADYETDEEHRWALEMTFHYIMQIRHLGAQAAMVMENFKNLAESQGVVIDSDLEMIMKREPVKKRRKKKR